MQEQGLAEGVQDAAVNIAAAGPANRGTMPSHLQAMQQQVRVQGLRQQRLWVCGCAGTAAAANHSYAQHCHVHGL